MKLFTTILTTGLLLTTTLCGVQAKADTFDTTVNRYAMADVECQNNGGPACDVRDMLAEELMTPGTVLCGRRTWYRNGATAAVRGADPAYCTVF